VAAARGPSRLRPQGQSGGDSVQPASQRSVFAKRAKSLRQHQEGGLEGVFSILMVLQDPPADAEDHLAVAAQDGLVNRLTAPGEKLLDELPVRLVSQCFCDHPPRQTTEEVAHVCRCHACLSPLCPALHTVVQRGDARWPTFSAGSFSKKVPEVARQD